MGYSRQLTLSGGRWGVGGLLLTPLSTCFLCLREAPRLRRLNPPGVLITRQSHANRMPIIYKSSANHMPIVCRSNANHSLMICQSHASQHVNRKPPITHHLDTHRTVITRPSHIYHPSITIHHSSITHSSPIFTYPSSILHPARPTLPLLLPPLVAAGSSCEGRHGLGEEASATLRTQPGASVAHRQGKTEHKFNLHVSTLYLHPPHVTLISFYLYTYLIELSYVYISSTSPRRD